jgi:hypothetical protein
MRNCTECDAELLDDDRFCAGCGTPVAHLTEDGVAKTNDDAINPASDELSASAAYDRAGPETSSPSTNDAPEPSLPPTRRTNSQPSDPDQVLASAPTGSDPNTHGLRLDWRDSAAVGAATAVELSPKNSDTGPPESTSLSNAKLGELEARLNDAIHEFTEGNISAATLARIEAEISLARCNTDREDTGDEAAEPQESEGSGVSGWRRSNPIAAWIIAGLVGLLLVVGLRSGDDIDDVLDPTEWQDNPIPGEKVDTTPVSKPFVVSTYCQKGAPLARSGVNYNIADALSSPTQYGPGQVVLVWSDGSQTRGGGSC